MAMQDLKISKKEAKESNKLSTPYEDQERYPYGLRLYMNNYSVEKQGITKLTAVETILMFEAKAKVVGSRQSATESSDNRSIELQITHLDLELDEDEVSEGELTRNEAGAMSKVAKKLSSM